jgi:hypothetical protein
MTRQRQGRESSERSDRGRGRREERRVAHPHSDEQLLAALQRSLGNQAMQRLARDGARASAVLGAVQTTSNQQIQRLAAAARQPGADVPIQRRVAVAKKDMKPDFVELTSINYAVQRAGGPVELLKDADFSKMTDEQELYLVAHGSPGSAGDYKAAEIVNYLFKGKRALTGPVKAIRFTSCNAGAGVTDDQTDSVVAAITQALTEKDWKGIPVSGARGPSIKTDALGDAFTVIDPKKKSDIFKIQDILKEIHQPKERTEREIKKFESEAGRVSTIEERAAIASRESAPFYEKLVEAVTDPAEFVRFLEQETQSGGSLVKYAPEMPTLRGLATKKLTLDKAMLEMVSTEKSSCFITTACVAARGLPDDCFELQTLRRFRDTYVRAQPDGEALIAQYYALAPAILRRLRARPEAPAVLAALYPCVAEAARRAAADQPEGALRLYREVVRTLAAAYLPRPRQRNPLGAGPGRWPERREDDGVTGSARTARRRSPGGRAAGEPGRRPAAGAAALHQRRRWGSGGVSAHRTAGGAGCQPGHSQPAPLLRQPG